MERVAYAKQQVWTVEETWNYVCKIPAKIRRHKSGCTGDAAESEDNPNNTANNVDEQETLFSVCFINKIWLVTLFHSLLLQSL